MSMKKIEIEIPDGKRAGWVDGVLTLVDEKPKDVTERIKTFEDACEELGNEHPFVQAYRMWDIYGISNQKDILAYFKLRVVCAALNEGWEPNFTEDERRYYPWFCLYNKTEFENMQEKDKKNLVIIDTGDSDTEYAGFAYAYSLRVPSNASADIGYRLCLKTGDLAEYCGKRFIGLWADYLLGRKGE